MLNTQPSTGTQLHFKRALVLGASGGIGALIAERLLQNDWQVVALKRDISDIPQDSPILWRKGDALNPQDVLYASQHCEVIFHCVNPPGYRDWDTLVLPMLESTLNAASQHNACVMLPGNVYNYAASAGTNINEKDQQNPASQKGGIRVQMEQRLKAFAQAGGQAIILRCGDFFGTRSPSSWFQQAIAPQGISSKRLLSPGTKGIGHQWAYLPDVAETMLQLVKRRQALPRFASFHMKGHWDATGQEIVHMTSAIIAQQTNKQPKVHTFPWWLIKLVAPFHRTSKELLEMKYLWQHPIRLDNKKLVAFLGYEPHTPWEKALLDTLQDGSSKTN